MEQLLQIGPVALLVWNGVVFLLYAVDKYRAKTGGWRIPEKTLLGAALLGGGVGALLGMRLVRHKTKHTSFKVIVPIGAVITLVLFGLMGWQYVSG